VARNIAKTPVRVAWAAALCSVALGVTLWTASGGAQLPGQAPPLRARDALKAAHEHYKHRDYDTAARYFEHARMAQGELTATERQDLSKLMQQNAVAMHARRDGSTLVRQAEQALQMGNPQEAGRLARVATANQYLSPMDRQALAALNDQMRRGGQPQAPNAEIVLKGEDAKSLLAGARQALDKGDLDFAEHLAKEADEKSGAFTWLPWGDSPAKVRRDVQAARAKQPAPMMPPHTVQGAPGTDKEGRQPVIGKVRNMLTPPWLRDKHDDAKPPEIPHSPQMVQQPAVPSHPTQYGPQDLGPLTTAPKNAPANLSPAEARAQAQRLIQEGYRHLDAKNFEAARQYAYQAKALRPDLAWSERNPDRLLADIQSRESGPAKTAVNSGPPGAPGAPGAAGTPGMTGTPADARTWIKQARVLMEREQFDDAEKLCNMAAAVPSVGWRLFEDSPERVRADLTEARTRRNREQAAALMVEARKLFAAGNLAQAKAKAYQAQQLHGPYSWWEMGERPQRLLEDIARAETGSGKAPVLPNDNPLNPNQLAQQSAPVDRSPPPVNLVSATTQAAARNQAKTLILQARELERGGFLIEARQKALEADALGVMFTPEEDNPRAVLLSLASKCDLRIAQLLQQATDFVQGNPNDPTRFQKAEINIHNARRLADAFGLDPAVIDQRTEWLQQMTGRTIRPISGTNDGPGLAHAEHKAPSVPLDADAQRLRQAGLEKLDKARLEIKAGNYAIARRIAEEAFNPSYHVQSDAAMVLRTIDAEEHLQQMTTAQKNFEAGLEAYHRKDFVRAGKIWQAVDLRLLPVEKRKQLAEMLEMPEMRGSGVVRTVANVPAGDGPAGKTTVSDLADNPFRVYTDMERVHAQKLRDRSLAAMDEALKLVQEKETQQAVDTLKEFLTTLQEAQINADLKLPIRRNVEQKLQQYSTLLAQQQLLDQQKTALSGGHNETLRTNNLQKRNEEVAALMKEGHQLYKEGRYEQALAKARMAKELDPDNYTVAGFIGQAETAARQSEFNDHLKRNEARFVQEVGLPDLGPNVSSRNPVHFDKEVSERNRNRKNESFSWQTKDPVERAIERQLEQPISGLNWKDTALSQVISDLEAMTGVNVEPDTRALREAGVSLDLPMTLSVENVKLKSALNLLLNQAKLTYVVKEQALVITTEDHARSKVRMVVHPVADLIVPVKDHKLPEVHDLSAALMRHINAVGNINYTGLTPSNPAFGIPFQTGLPRGHYGDSMATGPNGQPMSTAPVVGPQPHTGHLQDVLIDLIKNTVAQNSWRDVGGPGHIQYYPLGMALVVNQTLEVQEEVAALLQALRRLQDIEVAIEMKLVNVSEAFWERIGVDFDINIKTPHSRFEQNLLTGQFAPFGSVNRNLGVNGVVSGLTPAGTLTPDLNIPLKNSSYNFTIPPFGGYPGTLGQDGGLSLGLAFLNDIQVFMLLEAAQGDRRANVMQAPKLTVFNGQSAFLSITDQQFFLTGVQVAIPNNGNQFVFVPVQQPFPLGVTMSVTPVVSADRRFVRIELLPSLTNLASATVPLIPVQIPIPQFFDGPGTGTSQNTQPQFFTMFFQQPTFTTITLNTTVRVPDGGTVLLGGLKTLSEGRHEHGPPVLGKIPYLSRLFRNVAYGREAQSLMIMVTPRIIINEEEELIHLGDLPPVPRN